MLDFRFVGWEELKGYPSETSTKAVKFFLWGDRIEVVSEANGRSEIRGRSRNRTYFVDSDGLNGDALLEYYFCDVGQGDGVIIVTPERKHIVIDGGYPRAKQNTGKSLADFVDWKFFKDYRVDEITLDAVICSHNDQDHYGGLDDVLDTDQADELDCNSVSIETFYHAGLSWWKTATKNRTLGKTSRVSGKSYFVDLLTS
jgi:glyoxylase-like metal-dependent hydrolase (beta-lactamase superfamily II)